MNDERLDAHLMILTAALATYLRGLHVLWTAPGDDDLDTRVTRITAGVGARPAPSPDEIAEVSALLGRSHDGMLARIAAALGLSPGEEALVAAAWWSEADPQLAVVLGCAHDDRGRRHASAALLRLVLEPYGLEPPPVLDDDSVLVRSGVLAANGGAAGALQLTPTARLLLSGGLPQPLEVDDTVPARLEPETAGLVRRLRSGAGGTVVLRGATGIGRAAMAATAAAAADRVPVGGDRPAAELRLLARTGVGLPVVDAATAPELRWRASDGPLVAIAAPGESVAGSYVVDLPPPAFDERELTLASRVRLDRRSPTKDSPPRSRHASHSPNGTSSRRSPARTPMPCGTTGRSKRVTSGRPRGGSPSMRSSGSPHSSPRPSPSRTLSSRPNRSHNFVSSSPTSSFSTSCSTRGASGVACHAGRV